MIVARELRPLWRHEAERRQPAELAILRGDEQFSFAPTVIDFWRWALGDLRMNTARGFLATVARNRGQISDYATTTVAIGTGDPLQACIDAEMRTLVHDPWVMRRVEPLLRDAASRTSACADTRTPRQRTPTTC